MALMLNICRGRADDTQIIDSSCTSNATVGQSQAQADSLLCSASRTQATCTTAQCESEEINSGRALWTNSLKVAKVAGQVELSWSPEYGTPNAEPPKTYRLWARPDPMAPWTLLIETPLQSYTYTPPAGTSYQYDLSAEW
jgi:hypothetical protein